jgi:capsid protein
LDCFKQWLAENFYQDIYEKWLMFNAPRLIPTTLVDQVMYPIWRGRGFEWVDPLKDITASALAVDRGFETLSDVLGEKARTSRKRSIRSRTSGSIWRRKT